MNSAGALATANSARVNNAGPLRGDVNARVNAVKDDRGVATLEFALLAVVFVLMFMLATYAWRVTQAVGDVSDAAAEAARAASLALGDEAEAEAVANASLTAAGVACGAVFVIVSGGSTAAGGATVQTVSVSVECVVPLADLARIGVPGTQHIEATHTEVIDVYIGGT